MHTTGNRRFYVRILPLVAVVTLVIIVGWAGVRALAAWHFLAAQTITADMMDSGNSPQAQIDEANARVLRALGYLPAHPDYLDLAGLVQLIGADRPGVVGKAHREALQKAAGYFRKALAVRPLWPYSWANLLAVKDKLGEVDDEFHLALKRSIATGPWESGVQLQVLNSGLRHWDRLALAEKSLVREKIMDLLKVRPREVFEIVKRFGRPDLVCVEEVSYSQIKKWCQDVL